MKKPKRTFEWEEDDLDSSNKGGIDLEDMLDEEVIDLEEIVELPDGADDDEDQMNLDVELLDAEPDLDMGDLDSKLAGGDDDHLGDDLLKEFSLGGDSRSDSKKGGNPGILGKDMDEDLLKDFSFADSDSDTDEKLFGMEMNSSKEESAKGDDDDFEALMRMGDALFSEPAREATVATVAAAGAVAGAVAGAGSAQIESSSLDALVSQIENRLTEVVREVVEEKLPGIVQTMLREEIDRLKKEFKLG